MYHYPCLQKECLMCARLISAIVFLFLLASSLEARPVAIWSYEMLMEKSDVVLIGKVDSAKAFDEKLDDRSFGNVLEGQITTFKVRVVLEGKANGEKIELVHYLANPDKPMVNGPLSAYFPRQWSALDNHGRRWRRRETRTARGITRLPPVSQIPQRRAVRAGDRSGRFIVLGT